MPSTPVHEKPFTWIDVETTGLDSATNDIIEIAIVRVESERAEQVFHALIRMERPENAHPKALEVNGYSDGKWANAEDPSTIWQKIADQDLLRDCILAGQNVRFDAEFLNATFRRHGIDYRTDYHLYDTCTLALEHLKPWVKSVSLVPVCVALGIPVRKAHTALADVRLAMEVDRRLRRATEAARDHWSLVIPARLAAWEEAGRPNCWPVKQLSTFDASQL